MTGRSIALEPYRGTWPADDPDGGFRSLVAEYSRIDSLPTLETLGRNKGIPVGALAAFVLARYCCSGSDALLEIGPRVISQMDEIVARAEAAGSDGARLAAYRALAAIVSWLQVPLRDPAWRPGPGGRWLGGIPAASRGTERVPAPGAGSLAGDGGVRHD